MKGDYHYSRVTVVLVTSNWLNFALFPFVPYIFFAGLTKIQSHFFFCLHRVSSVFLFLYEVLVFVKLQRAF